MGQRSSSEGAFNTLGSGYSLPIADHKYEIRHALKMGEFGQKRRKSGYMDAVITRAKSCVDPRKYTT